MATIRSVLDKAIASLAGTDTPVLDAEVLLAHALECSRTTLIAWPERELGEHEIHRFGVLLLKRMQGIPVAYITGEREFWSLPLKVTEATLIPRPETETLVEFVLEKTADAGTLEVLEMGTGSGAIACALAVERPGWHLSASDISGEALAVARQNAARLESADIEFIRSNWFDQFDGRRFDIIVSNPPYVADADPHLQQGDARFEPSSALRSGVDGLDDIRILTTMAGSYLKPDGWLVLEHGYDQREHVRACFEQAGYRRIEQRSDLGGRPRLTAGRKP